MRGKRRCISCPLPLRERLPQCCNNKEWVRGSLRKTLFVKRPPHPSESAGALCVPSPARGEGTLAAPPRVQHCAGWNDFSYLSADSGPGSNNIITGGLGNDFGMATTPSTAAA